MIEENVFYFLKDEYFKDFPDKGLALNHETINGKKHGRPCFYAFKSKRNANIYWMIPISSHVAKYKALHEQKTKRYGKCDTIYFSKVKGKECAFLIQNMCPVTEKYIESKYAVANKPIHVEYTFQKTLVKSAQRVLNLAKSGRIKGLIFADIVKIERELIKQLAQEKKQQVQSAEQEKPKPKTKRKLVLEPKQDNGNDKYRGR